MGQTRFGNCGGFCPHAGECGQTSMPYAQTTHRSSTKLRRCTGRYIKTTASGMNSVGQASVGAGVRENVRAWAAEGTILLEGHMRFFERSQRADRAPVGCTYSSDRSHGKRSCAPGVPGHRGAREGHLEYLGLHPPQKPVPQRPSARLRSSLGW
jgi:hypothetical protein